MTTMRNDMHTRVSSFFVDIVFGFFLCSFSLRFCVLCWLRFLLYFCCIWVWVDFFQIGFCFLGIRKDIHSDECLFCVQWDVKSLKSFNHKDHYAILLHNAIVVRIVFCAKIFVKFEQDHQTDRTRQQSDIIGRTVLQMVAQKWCNSYYKLFASMA